MSDLINPLEYLVQIRDAFRELAPHPVPCEPYEPLITHGREWTPMKRPPWCKRRRPKMCYYNATQLALCDLSLTYVEGYATSIIPVAHAWCIDSSGSVIDPTWPHPEKCLYFGIPFKTMFVLETIAKSGYYGLLDDRITAPPEEFLETNWSIK